MMPIVKMGVGGVAGAVVVIGVKEGVNEALATFGPNASVCDRAMAVALGSIWGGIASPIIAGIKLYDILNKK